MYLASMSGMEEDASRFLRKIVWSLSSGLLWLFINLGIGIYNGWMVPEKNITAGNIIFYIWMALSLGALIWVNWRIWGKKES
jgi:FtsH-binding integral membrane protein